MSTTGDSPVTVTASARPATFIVSSIGAVWSTLTTMFSRTIVWKLASSSLAAYSPGGNERNRYTPALSVTPT